MERLEEIILAPDDLLPRERVFDRQYGRQRLNFEAHRAPRFFEQVLVGVRQQHHRFFRMIDEIRCQARLIFLYQRRAILAGNIVGSDDCKFVPGDSAFEMNLAEPAPRNRTAHRCAKEHAREREVAHIARAAGHFFSSFLTRYRPANVAVFHLEILSRESYRSFPPGAKGLLGLVAHERNHRNPPAGERLAYLIVNEGIAKSDCCRVFSSVGKINPCRPCPVDGAKAHRTRLAGRVNLTIGKLESSKFLASFADGDDLRVRSGIIARSDLVGALRDDFSIFHDDRGEGPTFSRSNIFEREFDGPRHEAIRHNGCAPYLADSRTLSAGPDPCRSLGSAGAQGYT